MGARHNNDAEWESRFSLDAGGGEALNYPSLTPARTGRARSEDGWLGSFIDIDFNTVLFRHWRYGRKQAWAVIWDPGPRFAAGSGS
jgi:hypothetical protein